MFFKRQNSSTVTKSSCQRIPLIGSHSYILRADSMGLSSYIFWQCAPKDASFLQ